MTLPFDKDHVLASWRRSPHCVCPVCERTDQGVTDRGRWIEVHTACMDRAIALDNGDAWQCEGCEKVIMHADEKPAAQDEDGNNFCAPCTGDEGHPPAVSSDHALHGDPSIDDPDA